MDLSLGAFSKDIARCKICEWLGFSLRQFYKNNGIKNEESVDAFLEFVCAYMRPKYSNLCIKELIQHRDLLDEQVLSAKKMNAVCEDLQMCSRTKTSIGDATVSVPNQVRVLVY